MLLLHVLADGPVAALDLAGAEEARDDLLAVVAALGVGERVGYGGELAPQALA